jgi:hypothetical protein
VAVAVKKSQPLQNSFIVARMVAVEALSHPVSNASKIEQPVDALHSGKEQRWM